jgi:outer membrane protein assembly factor BamD (BamD/ComL family)
LGKDGDYEAAVEKYQIILKQFEGTPAASRALPALVQTTFDWAARLQKDKHFVDAIQKYSWIVSNYPTSPLVTRTKVAITRAFVE